MKYDIYVGIIRKDGTAEVLKNGNELLRPNGSQRLFDFNGFDWRKGNEIGHRNLAEAILTDFLGNEAKAQGLAREFAEEFIKDLEAKGRLTGWVILNWDIYEFLEKRGIKEEGQAAAG